MAFKAGPKSKRIQELEAKLGIAATPIKPTAPLSVHLQKQTESNSVLRPNFGITPTSSSPSGYNKFDEKRDRPQTATMCWHRQQKDYKVIYLSPHSSSTSAGLDSSSSLGSPPSSRNSFSFSTPAAPVISSTSPSAQTTSPSPTARSPPPSSSPPPPPSRHVTPSHSQSETSPVSTPSEPQQSFNEETEPESQVSVHRFEGSPPPAQEQPVRLVASPSAREESFEDSSSASPDQPTTASAPKPVQSASQIPQPTKRFGEGDTPKERALNALKKVNVAHQPSRIPSVSSTSNIISPKVSTKQIFADLDSPTNKESKLRAPSKTSALRAAFEREAALINEPPKPPIVPTKKPFVMPQAEKPVEAPLKQSEPPPSGLSDVTKSWVEGEGFATGWHTKPNKFEVHARDAAGQVVTGTKCVVEMKSRVVHAAPIQVVVRKNTDGSHMCAYVPWHQGDFTMTIYLDGRILSEKLVRVRPASERHAAEIEEAARKQEEANKRRAEEQRSRILAPLSKVSDEAPSQPSQSDDAEFEAAKAQDEEARLEQQRREEILRQEEEKREQERALQLEKELAEAEAIAREKLAYEEAARKVAEEEERQQAEHELRILELEEARLEAEEREQQAKLLEERAAAEKELEEEFEIAKHQADLEEAEEARRIATRLREEAETAQRQIEEEFEEAKRLADLEEMEELRQQSELELSRLEHAKLLEHDAQEQIDRDKAFLHLHEPHQLVTEHHAAEEPGAEWELPSPPAGQPEEDPLHGLDPEEAVRQAAARGRTRSPKKPEEEGEVLRAVEESDIAQALSEAAHRAQQEVTQTEIERIKREEEARRVEEENERMEAIRRREEAERELAEEKQRKEAEEKQRKEAETASNIVNIHSSPSGHARDKEELRRQVPTKRPPPPQKRPPAPPGAGHSPKPTEAKKATSPAPAATTEPSSTIICACGESNPSNMKFCSGCGKRLAGGATHVSMHSFVESQRAAAEKARLEADPEAAEREAKEAEAQRQREREREIQRAEKEARDAKQWEETQKALDDAESAPPVPPFVESDSVMFHVGVKAPDSPALLTRTLDPSQCWLEGEGAEVGWHTRSNKFMVHARDSEGNPVPDTQCVAEMKSIAPRVPPISVIVHKNSEGTHTCAYLPFNEGEFMLSVSLNGQPIRDTPRKVIVKRR